MNVNDPTKSVATTHFDITDQYGYIKLTVKEHNNNVLITSPSMNTTYELTGASENFNAHDLLSMLALAKVA